MNIRILFIDHSYHTKTKSADFFVEFLKGIGNLTIELDDCWQDGIVRKNYKSIVDDYDLVIVWQLPEVIRHIAEFYRGNLVFIPMYDAAHNLSRRFWKRMKRVKIVCFSAALKAQCATYGLDTYFIQYYPENSTPAAIGYHSKSLFFWQRREWPNWTTVMAALPSSQFEKLHFHLALDPGIKSDVVPTQSELAIGKITQSSWFEKKEDLVNKLREFNVLFVARELEGIGFGFLDAMRLGLIPVGFNASTYNEYVVDGVNGFIISGDQRIDLPDLLPVSANLIHYFEKGRKIYDRNLELLKVFLNKPNRPPNYLIPSFLQGAWRKRIPTRITSKRDLYKGTMPLVSLVTVVKNDMVGLTKTFQSVFEQTFKNYEYIVIDGNSTDKTVSMIHTHRSSIEHFISENDNGPYDAMIKGAKLASGRYVMFLNAGDEFAESTSLADAMESVPEHAEIIYGHHYYIQKKRTKVHLARNLDLTYRELKLGKISMAWLLGIPCHQATMVNRELLLRMGFNPELRIAADHAFLFEACSQGCSNYHTNTFITKYHSGGFSSKTKSLCHAEWKKLALDHSDDSDAIDSFYRKLR